MAIAVGKKIPAFKAENQNGETVSNKDLQGQWLVLYFYPKDNTPGCTNEAKDFTRLRAQFEEKGAQIVGVSPDSVATHKKFIEKHQLDVDLLSDVDKSMCDKFGVWQQKNMAGREYMGVVRSTFLVDPDGKLVNQWSKVRVKEHAVNVLKELDGLI